MYDKFVSAGFLLHADADCFYASVVQRRDPKLRERPMAVVAHVFIASANYPARALGVRGGMFAQEAHALHPGLLLIDAPREEIETTGDALFDLFHDLADAVEPGSIEEAFLDVGARTLADAERAARQLRRRAAEEIGIPVSVGIGRTKLMAKLASRAAKPDGLHVIDETREAYLREHLSISDVWGIGQRTRERLALLGVHALHDLDSIGAERLASACGVLMSRRLISIRQGTDSATLNPVSARSSLSAELATSGYRRRDWDPLEMIDACTARVTQRARKAMVAAAGLSVSLLPVEGKAIVRRASSPYATAAAEHWLPVARSLCDSDELPRLRGLRVTLTGLIPEAHVPSMLF